MQEKKTFKEWFDDFKVRVKWKAEDCKAWIGKNKDTLVVIVPFAVGGLLEITKIITRNNNTKELKRLKENYIYDRRNGHYCETKRKLKSRELRELDERYQDGESVSVILDDMRLSKR